MSLKYYHLFSPGQALVKILLRQEVMRMHETIADIFIGGSTTEKKHMIEHWSCLWSQNDKDAIFSHIYAECDFDSVVQMARVEPDVFGHLVILRNIFARQFAGYGFDMASIDGVIRDGWINMADGFFVEQQVYEIFVENVHSNLEIGESLQFLRRFIQSRYEVQDANLRQNLLQKLPHLLQHLAKISPIDPFFRFIHELFEAGVASEIYQRQIFALKICKHVLTVFKSAEQLESLHWDLNDGRHHEALLNLATSSDFDDVRALAYELTSKFKAGPPMVEKSLYQLPYPHFKTRLIIAASLKADDLPGMRASFATALEVTESSLKQMKNDPLNAAKNEVNLFKPLDCLNEFLLIESLKLETLEDDGELIELVKCVADVIIDLINSKEQGLDFSKLDENLELLVEQSQVRSNNVEKDKKLLLHSFWHTLRVSRGSFLPRNAF